MSWFPQLHMFVLSFLICSFAQLVSCSCQLLCLFLNSFFCKTAFAFLSIAFSFLSIAFSFFSYTCCSVLWGLFSSVIQQPLNEDSTLVNWFVKDVGSIYSWGHSPPLSVPLSYLHTSSSLLIRVTLLACLISPSACPMYFLTLPASYLPFTCFLLLSFICLVFIFIYLFIFKIDLSIYIHTFIHSHVALFLWLL